MMVGWILLGKIWFRCTERKAARSIVLGLNSPSHETRCVSSTRVAYQAVIRRLGIIPDIPDALKSESSLNTGHRMLFFF